MIYDHKVRIILFLINFLLSLYYYTNFVSCWIMLGNFLKKYEKFWENLFRRHKSPLSIILYVWICKRSKIWNKVITSVGKGVFIYFFTTIYFNLFFQGEKPLIVIWVMTIIGLKTLVNSKFKNLKFKNSKKFHKFKNFQKPSKTFKNQNLKNFKNSEIQKS